MNPGFPPDFLITERQRAILRILADAGLVEGGRRTDGTPHDGTPAQGLAMMIDMALSAAATEQDVLDILSWGNRELHAARPIMALYEPPPVPASCCGGHLFVRMTASRRSLSAIR